MDERLPPLPRQVRKRGGRVESFAREKIHGALFAALASLGTSDAFFASELTDSVLHFLRHDEPPDPVPTAHIAETLIKVMRELGQAQLAYRFDLSGRERRRLEPQAASPPPGPSLPATIPLDVIDWVNTLSGAEAARRCGAVLLEQLMGPALYPRQLWAAHVEGLLRLGGLTHPNRLAELTTRLTPRDPQGCLARAADLTSQRVDFEAVDAELGLINFPSDEIPGLVRQLAMAAAAHGLEVMLHLNAPTPTWAQPTLGPLFPPALFTPAEAASGPAAWRPWRAALTQAINLDAHPCLGIVWHTQGTTSLDELAEAQPRWHAQGRTVEVVLRRSKTPRFETPDGILADFTLDLGVLRHRQQQRFHLDAFVGKIASLARLALSAGQTLRQFLRQTATPWPVFLLEHAQVRLTLLGIHELLPEIADEFALATLAEAEGVFHQHLARPLLPTLRAEGAFLAPRLTIGPHVRSEEWDHLGRCLAPWGPNGTALLHPDADLSPWLEHVASHTAIPRVRQLGRPRGGRKT